MRKSMLFFLLVYSIVCSAQKTSFKFGDIPMEDMKMTVYPKDSSAEAVVLCDYGKLESFTFTRHTRIKILKKEGLNFADVQQLIFSTGTVNIIKASTFNLENGQIVETRLTDKGIFNKNFNKSYKLATFTMPSVKVGSVIEYIYATQSSPLEWRFQSEIPTRWSEYSVHFWNSLSMRKYIQGYVPVTSFKETAGDGHHWIIKDVPAFKKEPYMTNMEDYISKVVYVVDNLQGVDRFGLYAISFANTWEKMHELLPKDEDFGQLISGSAFLKDLVSQTTAGIQDSALKVKALTNYVKQNFEWDGYKDLLGSSLKKIVEKRRGNSGELNLLLASMLDKAGFDVEMILLSTRDHGFIRKSYPSMRQFNYTICAVKIGGKTLLLDATEKYLPFNVLPDFCINGEGLIISKKKTGWIELVPTVKNKTYIEADVVLSTGGEINGKLSYVHDGYDAVNARKDFFSKEEDAYSKKILNGKKWIVKKKKFDDMEDVSKSAKSTYEITDEDYAMVNGDMIFFNPNVTSRIENPFKSETRTYPIEFGSRIDKVCVSKITVPDDYIVSELPKGLALMLPENSGRFTYNISQIGNSINVTSSFQVNKSLFVQFEYPQLREFFSQIVAKQTEQIVLKKRN